MDRTHLKLMQKLTEAQERQKHLFKSVLGVDVDAIATEVLAAHRLEKATLFADSVKNLAPLMVANSGLKGGAWMMIKNNAIALSIRKLGKE